MMADNQSNHFFIDDERRIYTGEEALAYLKKREPSGIIDPEKGVVRIDRARWEEAQRYERRTWMVDCRFHVDDRNEYHREHFANYAPIRGRKFERAIELGSGPFTNMRLILGDCEIGEIHLLDPLMNDYLHHLFCSYRSGRIGGGLNPRNLLRDIGHFRTPARAWKSWLNSWKIGGLLGRRVNLIPSMIEAFSTDLKFDLVVMVNVIEHCLDVTKIFDKILELLSPGGIFVFGDVLYNAKEVQQLSTVAFDAGHPLQVDGSVIRPFLADHFDALMSAEYPSNSEFAGVRQHRTELYYIGVRR